MKIFSAKQIRDWDKFTIRHEPVDSIYLMERAASRCTDWLLKNIAEDKEFCIFCGKGNNGGDGLAIARLLLLQNRRVSVYVIESYTNASPDFTTNFQRLEKRHGGILTIWNKEDIPVLSKEAIVIDALYGSGLNRPMEGLAAELVHRINQSANTVVSIDMPSGLFADKSSAGGEIVKADYTLSFQQYKLAFLLAENEKYTGEIIILDIGLHAQFVDQTESAFELIERQKIKSLLLPRRRFSHKGSFGHAALLSGSYGMMGAAILAAGACLRSGVGKVTVQVPNCGVNILQVALPEAICLPDSSQTQLKEMPDPGKYDAIGIGPGIGTHKDTIELLVELLQQSRKPLVLDADALNILAAIPQLIDKIPAHSIISPHPREFERLFGESRNDFERINQSIQQAKELGIYIILKGHYSFIASPDGKGFFNSTGNPGMATAGSGDVLTGILLGLLAQGYEPEQVCLLGVYWHGLAGDLAAKKFSQPSMIAGDIIESMGEAFLSISSS